MVDLGTLGGMRSRAVDVSGEVVVGSSDLAGTAYQRAFAYDLAAESPAMVDLGTLGGGGSLATAVSDGIVVGNAQLADGTTHAFAYDLRAVTPEMVDLGTLGGRYSYAVGVSGSFVIGNSFLAGDSVPRAFVSDLATKDPTMVDLGTLGGTSSTVADIDDGVAVGYSSVDRDRSYPFHAFAYDLRAEVPKMVDLGALDGVSSQASGVSGSIVIGQTAPEGWAPSRSWVYDLDAANPSMAQLPTLDGGQGFAAAVSGDVIVGSSTLRAVAWRLAPRAVPLRLGGASRYDTAAAISRDSFPKGADLVVVTTGLKFPDALAGGAAAVALGGPLLLTEQHAVPVATLDELVRLAPSRILLLGGSQAAADEVRAALEEIAPVERVFGADRYETAAAVSRHAFPAATDVYVATGQAFPDALVAAAAAGQQGAPVILVSDNALPVAARAELSRLGPQRITVVGGNGAVSDDVVQELQEFAPVERAEGADRYATAAVLAERTFETSDAVYIATGLRFPDALAGVPAAGRAGAPVLLVHDSVPDDTERELERLRPFRIVVLGGTAAVSDLVASELARHL